MDTPPYRESPVEWLQLLEEIREISERCHDRLMELRNRFPSDWPELPSESAELRAGGNPLMRPPEAVEGAGYSPTEMNGR